MFTVPLLSGGLIYILEIRVVTDLVTKELRL